MDYCDSCFAFLQVKTEQTGKNVQDGQDAKPKAQKAKQKQASMLSCVGQLVTYSPVFKKLHKQARTPVVFDVKS